MGESFWQKDSLITHIIFELQPIMIFSLVANFGDQSLIIMHINLFIFFSAAHEEFDKDEQIRKQSPKLPFQHYVQTANIKTSLEKKKYRIDDGKSFCFYLYTRNQALRAWF